MGGYIFRFFGYEWNFSFDIKKGMIWIFNKFVEIIVVIFGMYKSGFGGVNKYVLDYFLR